ncbi:zinc ribbon domain-containing protein [Holophaga foetida]|uniref:zinc ribbon domain-containing protein n=1 Tax=Holophaga foetida TaxID=35839 RepID=UPI0002473ED8|nr:C4-type zinc ribbon domain-containing protein [Holophaga foetida]
MSVLPILQELQSVHDNLAVIQRDLNNFPPELATLDADLKTTQKRLSDIAKTLEALETKRQEMSKTLDQAQNLEDSARTSVKAAKQKVQYAAALRDLDARERERNAVARPMKETEQRIEALKAESIELEAKEIKLQGEFNDYHATFLAEHENQVVAEKRLTIRRAELEQALGSSELNRFNRILQQRQGKALVAVEGGTCTGCRTKVRSMVLHQLKETGMVSCESCQRYLMQPANS